MNNLVNTIQSILNDAQSQDDFLDYPLTVISKIHITIIDRVGDWEAKITPIVLHGKLNFELYIKSNIVEYLNSKDIEQNKYGKSIIFHELYHVKEFLITNHAIPLMPIYDIIRNSTHSMLLYLGYIQWTEYYAHFNSTKYYQPTSDDIRESAELIAEILSTIKMGIDTYAEYQLPEGLFKGINLFISQTVILSARYNQTHDKSYMIQPQSIKSATDFKKQYNYINQIILYMDNLYQTYPAWISEEKFLEIGKTLFSIIHEYGITYSTPDLSDNFIFVSI